MSPQFNAKQHRWRENSYDFQVEPIDGGVIFIAFVSETFFGLKNASNWSGRSTKKIAVNVKFSSKTDCSHYGGSGREICHLP